MGKKTVKTQEGDAAAKEAKAVAAGGAEATATKAAGAAKRKAKHVQEGKVYVNATYNNTVVTVTDTTGNVLAWASAGSLGFSGPKKATPFASSKVIAGDYGKDPGQRPEGHLGDRKGDRLRPRLRDPLAHQQRLQHPFHQRRHAGAAQRPAPAQDTARLICYSINYVNHYYERS